MSLDFFLLKKFNFLAGDLQDLQLHSILNIPLISRYHIKYILLREGGEGALRAPCGEVIGDMNYSVCRRQTMNCSIAWINSLTYLTTQILREFSQKTSIPKYLADFDNNSIFGKSNNYNIEKVHFSKFPPSIPNMSKMVY